MLQSRLLLFISIVLLHWKSVIAFPHLNPRQNDNIWNLDWEKIPGLFTGIGGFGTYLHLQQSGQQDEPAQDDTTTKTPQEKTIPGPALPGPLQQDELNYQLGNPPETPEPPPPEPGLPAPQCEMTNIFSSGCGKALDRLIFTTGCAKIAKGQVPTMEATSQNGAILAKLNRMAPGRVRTSTSKHCGIYMMMASLTAEQSHQIEVMPGVSFVSSNIFFNTRDGSTNEPQAQPGEIEPAFKRRKRATVRQQRAPAHLQFLSTAENYPGITTDYVYDSTAGEDTVVFPIGPGLTMNHQEFARNPITRDDFIFAFDVPTSSTLLANSFGTCMASLIGGINFGVSKKTKIKPVRIESHVGSLIDAMVQIGNYISARVDPPGGGQPGNGFVMMMDMAWQNTEPTTTQKFEEIFSLLMFDYDVVTVVAAGTDTSSSYQDIDSYPALYAAEFPVIAVGGVDMRGERFSWSRGGTGLTVTAPGSVQCASNAGGTATEDRLTGTALAAAQVAGLAAYFLALYPHLRAAQNTVDGSALAVKNFIADHAWARLPGGDKSIWNLMGPDILNPSGNGIGPNSPF